jgi:hypothetical protein
VCRLVLEQKRTERSGAEAEQDEDRREARHEQEAASKQSAVNRVRRLAADRGEVAGHERQTTERLDRSGIWPRVGGGCHCARDTVAAIEAAGLDIEQVRSLDFGPSWIVTNPHMLGIAYATPS